MKTDNLSFESVTRLHMISTPERQQAGLRAWAAALVGEAQEDEVLFNLTEIGKEVRTHPVWLSKLEIQKHCGERLGGRFRYRKSAVLSFLRSDACLARIAELNGRRRAKEQAKKEKAILTDHAATAASGPA